MESSQRVHWKVGSRWEHQDYDDPKRVDIVGQVVESTPPSRLVVTWALPADEGNPIEKQGGTWEAFFWVTDVEALHSEFKSKGADVVYGPLIQESYRMNEFAIRDCDGHVLGFGETLASES